MFWTLTFWIFDISLSLSLAKSCIPATGRT